MADGRLSSGRVRGVEAGAAGVARASQLVPRTIYNYPSDEGQSSQALVRSMWGGHGGLAAEANQTRARILYFNYAEKPHLRAWGFSLDGHDFYVLRLGTLWTMVLDLTTGQWSEWNGHNLPYWRAHRGINWLGMGKTTADRLYGTNIVAGDDRAGVLWMLDPTAGVDDAPAVDLEPVPYTRTVTGLVPMRMRETQSCAGVYITLSLGRPILTGAAITLRMSDDWGKSYWDAGTVTVEQGNYTQEVAYRGLGLIRAPGRIFELSDQGAAVRINGMEMR